MSARTRLASLVGVAAAAVLAVAVALTGASDDERRATGSGKLTWEMAPLLVTDVGRKGDRVIVGTVRNASRHRLRLSSADIKVLDAGGHRVPAYARFTATYSHGLYGAYPRVARQPESERRRLGLEIALETGQTAPLFVAFRPGARRQEPLAIVYDRLGETLPVPPRGTPARPEARTG